MKFKCSLPPKLAREAGELSEFANGATQATVKLADGRVYEQVLISACSAVVAVRGYKSPPFDASQIVELYQSPEDKNPSQRGGWEYWDEWK